MIKIYSLSFKPILNLVNLVIWNSYIQENSTPLDYYNYSIFAVERIPLQDNLFLYCTKHLVINIHKQRLGSSTFSLYFHWPIFIYLVLYTGMFNGDLRCVKIIKKPLELDKLETDK